MEDLHEAEAALDKAIRSNESREHVVDSNVAPITETSLVGKSGVPPVRPDASTSKELGQESSLRQKIAWILDHHYCHVSKRVDLCYYL